MASKTWNGHAEPAAGLVATLHAVEALHHRAMLLLLHLRRLNPYVADAWEASVEHGTTGPWARVGRLRARAAGSCRHAASVPSRSRYCLVYPMHALWSPLRFCCGALLQMIMRRVQHPLCIRQTSTEASCGLKQAMGARLSPPPAAFT